MLWGSQGELSKIEQVLDVVLWGAGLHAVDRRCLDGAVLVLLTVHRVTRLITVCSHRSRPDRANTDNAQISNELLDQSRHPLPTERSVQRHLAAQTFSARRRNPSERAAGVGWKPACPDGPCGSAQELCLVHLVSKWCGLGAQAVLVSGPNA